MAQETEEFCHVDENCLNDEDKELFWCWQDNMDGKYKI